METPKTWWVFLFYCFVFQICKTPEIKKDVLEFHMHVWKGSFFKKNDAWNENAAPSCQLDQV